MKNKGQQLSETIIILSICFILMLVVYFLTSALITKTTTEEKMETERVIFDMYIASKSNITSVESVLKENKVEGFAIYDKNGRIYFKYGETPEFDDIPERYFLGDYSDIRIRAKGIEYIARPKSQSVSPLAPQGSSSSVFSNKSPDPSSEENTALPIVYIRRVDVGAAHRIMTLRIVSISSMLIIVILGATLLGYRKRALELLEKLNKNDATATVGEAARTLAHEIKNPLSTILIQTAILKRKHPDSEEDFNEIENEVNRILVLADRTTGFLSNPIGNPKDIALVPFCREFYNRFDYPLSVAFEPNCEDVEVFFDEVRLRSVIENLIKNAIESMQSQNIYGSEKEPIRLEISEQGRTNVRLLVEDRGQGLPTDVNTEDLFNAFFTTKTTGSGIGLSICRQFVEAEGGEIHLYPREGGGTIAEVVFKRAKK